MSTPTYLSAEEAAARLNISKSTLYAYVSRGLISSQAGDGKSRKKRYLLSDIESLQKKQTIRKNPSEAAHTSLQHGLPVLDSAITLIENGQLRYRGTLVENLIRQSSFESVAAWLWEWEEEEPLFRPFELKVEIQQAFADLPASLSPIEHYQTILPYLAANDLGGYDRSERQLQRTGSRIIQQLSGLTAGKSQTELGNFGIADLLRSTWLGEEKNEDLTPVIDAMLILCADHELNVSAFTARCIASAGTTLYQVVIGSLAALQGVRHGGQSERVAAMLAEVASNVPQRLTTFIKRGEHIPGFDHPLYPDGDPRGRLLLDLAQQHALDHDRLEKATQVAQFIFEAQGRYPNLDFGLVTLCQALRLPKETPIRLFALGRTAGWVAHAIEQIKTGQLIRPRARYVGKRTG